MNIVLAVFRHFYDLPILKEVLYSPCPSYVPIPIPTLFMKIFQDGYHRQEKYTSGKENCDVLFHSVEYALCNLLKAAFNFEQKNNQCTQILK